MEISELITSLRCCGKNPNIQNCKNECAFYFDGLSIVHLDQCVKPMTQACADALKQLRAENAAKDAEIERLKALANDVSTLADIMQDNDRLQEELDKLSRPTLSQLRREVIQYKGRCERLTSYEETGLEPEEISLYVKCQAQSVSRRECELAKKVEAYEAIGTIDDLTALAKARDEGRVVALPCKVGDMVWTNFAMSGWYFRDKDKPYSANVAFVGLNDSEEMGGGLLNIVYGKHDYMMQFRFSDFGKTVFLTRAEAEAALKGASDGDG